MANELEQQVLKKAQTWLDGNYDEATKKQVKYLMENDMKELVESFYKDLEFGTGGLRGIMGVGSNRMNVYTVGTATQGLANYLKKNFAGEQVRVAVAHDSRNNSRMFAERVADMFDNAFGFTKKVGNSSVFASTYVECMKQPFRGKMGHIAVATNSVKRAMYQLEMRGYTVDPSSVKYDKKGVPTVAYLNEDFGGFAVHLVLRK